MMMATRRRLYGEVCYSMRINTVAVDLLGFMSLIIALIIFGLAG